MPEPHKTKDLVDQSWYKRYPRDEIAETSILNGEEYGILQRFRDYSLIHGGIEDDKELIRRIGATFHLSRYKLNKIWNRIENFLTLRDGRFIYEQDEQERHHLFIISSKRSLAGKLGAAARWSDRNAPALEPQKSGMANAIGTTERLPSENPAELDPEPDLETRGGAPAAAASSMGQASHAAAAAGSPPAHSPPETPPHQRVTDGQADPLPPEQRAFQAVSERCAEIGLPIPSPDIALQVVKKFPDFTIEDVAKILPRFPDQKSAALWLHKSAQEIQMEAQRQYDSSGVHPEAKPTVKDLHRKRMLDWARKMDEQRKAQGS